MNINKTAAFVALLVGVIGGAVADGVVPTAWLKYVVEILSALHLVQAFLDKIVKPNVASDAQPPAVAAMAAKGGAAVFLLCLLAFAPTAHAQAVSNATGYELPDQTITGGAYFDQAASPQIQGDINYSRHISSGVYSYTEIRITSISFVPVAGQKLPRVEVQTQTETGACTYVATVAGFAFSTCVAPGLAATSSQTGLSASGNLVGLRRTGWKDSLWGFNAGPSYSGVSGGVSWLFGLRLGWGK